MLLSLLYLAGSFWEQYLSTMTCINMLYVFIDIIKTILIV